MKRSVTTDTANDGKITGTTAVPNRATSPALVVQEGEHHVGLVDKIRGQIKIAKGVLKHDPNLTQEGEILKHDGEEVLLGRPHMEAASKSKATGP